MSWVRFVLFFVFVYFSRDSIPAYLTGFFYGAYMAIVYLVDDKF